MLTNNETCLLCGGKECRTERYNYDCPIIIHCGQHENTVAFIDSSIIASEDKVEVKRRCNMISKFLLEHKKEIAKEREPKLYKFFYKCVYELKKNDLSAIDVSELESHIYEAVSVQSKEK